MTRNSSKPDESIPCGLILRGTVVKRTRRYAEMKNGDQVEIVTYIVSDDEKKKYIVEDFAPDCYYDTGLLASIPVYIKPFQKKSGSLSYTLNVQKDFSYVSVGEDF